MFLASRHSLLLSIVFLIAPLVAGAHPTHRATKKVEAEYLAQSIAIKDQLMRDYESLLHVYYELKRNELKHNELKKRRTPPATFPNPTYNPSLAADLTLPPEIRERLSLPKVERISEFSLDAYNEFKDALDRDPRLKDNTYVQRMKEYGSGQANDIFQRVTSYALEPFAERLPRSEQIRLYMKDGNDLMALALIEGQEVFRRVSAIAGFPLNGVQSDMNRKFDLVEKIQKRRIELKKAGSCPALFLTTVH